MLRRPPRSTRTDTRVPSTTRFRSPGKSSPAALDARHDTPEIDLGVRRQEGGVTYMAEADGKMTGRPGVAFVTRGPGATNASVGIHVAMQDSTPMILFIRDVARSAPDRAGVPELEFPTTFAPLANCAARRHPAPPPPPPSRPP